MYWKAKQQSVVSAELTSKKKMIRKSLLNIFCSSLYFSDRCSLFNYIVNYWSPVLHLKGFHKRRQCISHIVVIGPLVYMLQTWQQSKKEQFNYIPLPPASQNLCAHTHTHTSASAYALQSSRTVQFHCMIGIQASDSWQPLGLPSLCKTWGNGCSLGSRGLRSSTTTTHRQAGRWWSCVY